MTTMGRRPSVLMHSFELRRQQLRRELEKARVGLGAPPTERELSRRAHSISPEDLTIRLETGRFETFE